MHRYIGLNEQVCTRTQIHVHIDTLNNTKQHFAADIETCISPMRHVTQQHAFTNLIPVATELNAYHRLKMDLYYYTQSSYSCTFSIPLPSLHALYE